MKLTEDQIKAKILGINTRELAIKLLVKLDDEILQARSMAKLNFCKRKIKLIEKGLKETRF